MTGQRPLWLALRPPGANNDDRLSAPTDPGSGVDPLATALAQLVRDRWANQTRPVAFRPHLMNMANVTEDRSRDGEAVG